MSVSFAFSFYAFYTFGAFGAFDAFVDGENGNGRIVGFAIGPFFGFNEAIDWIEPQQKISPEVVTAYDWFSAA